VLRLSDIAAREEHRVKISNRGAALENLDGSRDINTIAEYIEHKISAKGSKLHYESHM
jgi:hypothetical protein